MKAARGSTLKRAPRSNGVTLIELLVSITLLSLLSVGLLMTLRVGLNAMDKANSKLMANRRVASVERIMRSEIESLIPVVAQCVPQGQRPREALMYFLGRPDSMRFVSAYSLQEASRGLPRILDFQVLPGDLGIGVRLVVTELIYSPEQAGATCAGSARDPDTGDEIPVFGRSRLARVRSCWPTSWRTAAFVTGTSNRRRWASAGSRCGRRGDGPRRCGSIWPLSIPTPRACR